MSQQQKKNQSLLKSRPMPMVCILLGIFLKNSALLDMGMHSFRQGLVTDMTRGCTRSA